jgi:hypothetical protein
VNPQGSGSRFAPFGDVSDGENEISMAEEVAWPGLEDIPRVLPLGDAGGMGDGERLDDFWSKIGFPTAESRSWERKSIAGAVEQRARSSSPAKSAAIVEGGRTESAPPVFRMHKPSVKLKTWKGPLPPKRITPPAVLADFFPPNDGALPAGAAGEDLEAPKQPAMATAAVNAVTSSSSTSQAQFEPRHESGEGSMVAPGGPHRGWAGLGRAISAMQRAYADHI